MMVHPRDPHDPKGLADEEAYVDRAQDTEVSPIVAEAIGKALQAHYRAIADLPLPDRLLVLLAELEARERRHEE
jgi:hypothetical protein